MKKILLFIGIGLILAKLCFGAGTNVHPITYSRADSVVQASDWNGAWVVQGITNDIITQDAAYNWVSTVISRDSNYTLSLTEDVVLCEGTITITLPAAFMGKRYYIKNWASGIVTVDGDGTETIDGETTVDLDEGTGLLLIANPDGWTKQ